MSGPERLDFGGAGGPRPTHCQGACLVLDRQGFSAYEREGVAWAGPWADQQPASPDRERRRCRVRCGGEELQVLRQGVVYSYGMCSSCAGLEARHRRVLSELASRRSYDGR